MIEEADPFTELRNKGITGSMEKENNVKKEKDKFNYEGSQSTPSLISESRSNSVHQPNTRKDEHSSYVSPSNFIEANEEQSYHNADNNEIPMLYSISQLAFIDDGGGGKEDVGGGFALELEKEGFEEESLVNSESILSAGIPEKNEVISRIKSIFSKESNITLRERIIKGEEKSVIEKRIDVQIKSNINPPEVNQKAPLDDDNIDSDCSVDDESVFTRSERHETGSIEEQIHQDINTTERNVRLSNSKESKCLLKKLRNSSTASKKQSKDIERPSNDTPFVNEPLNQFVKKPENKPSVLAKKSNTVAVGKLSTRVIEEDKGSKITEFVPSLKPMNYMDEQVELIKRKQIIANTYQDNDDTIKYRESSSESRSAEESPIIRKDTPRNKQKKTKPKISLTEKTSTFKPGTELITSTKENYKSSSIYSSIEPSLTKKELILKYRNHCAITIQKVVRGYLTRKRVLHRLYKQIYNAELRRALVVGWKVRKIFNCSRLKGMKIRIKTITRKLSNVRNKKEREELCCLRKACVEKFISLMQILYLTGDWVEHYKKDKSMHNLYGTISSKETDSYVENRQRYNTARIQKTTRRVEYERPKRSANILPYQNYNEPPQIFNYWPNSNPCTYQNHKQYL